MDATFATPQHSLKGTLETLAGREVLTTNLEYHYSHLFSRFALR